jgi:hypothetical protein
LTGAATFIFPATAGLPTTFAGGFAATGFAAGFAAAALATTFFATGRADFADFAADFAPVATTFFAGFAAGFFDDFETFLAAVVLRLVAISPPPVRETYGLEGRPSSSSSS